MSRFIDLTGKRFGRLVVIERAQNKGNSTMFLCECDCGTKKMVASIRLRRGITKSCGCLSGEMSSSRNTTHGAGNEPWYGSWMGMVRRMTNPKEPAYKKYVIENKLTIAAEFLTNPWAFYEEIGEYPGKGYSIDRIDNNVGYIKGNIRWATPAIQASNKGVYKSSKSSVPGITIDNQKRRWAVRVYSGKKTYFVGYYENLSDAISAQNEKKKELNMETS